jgi:hypothetical protein
VTLAPAEQNCDRQEATTSLITWVCYGAWLPGRSGAVPRTQNRFGAPLPDQGTTRERQSRDRMKQDPYVLGAVCRQVVLESLQEACSYRGWTLLAAHVRTNHVHVVTKATCKPEQVMNTMKAYSSRALNEYALEGPDRRRWAPWQYTLPLDWKCHPGSDPVRCSGTGRIDGGVRNARPSLTLRVQKIVS